MPSEPDRRQDQRRGNLLADDRGGEAALGDIDQHALAQLDGFEVGPVGAQGLFVIGAAVGVIEEGARHLAAGALAQIGNAGDVFHGMPRADRSGTR